MKRNHKSLHGFTLIELLVVIAMVGVMFSFLILVINPFKQIQKARDAQREADLSHIRQGLDAYYNDHNCFPTTLSFGNSWQQGSTVYMKKIPQDPDCSGGGSCYQYLIDPATCPQWNVLFSKALGNDNSISCALKSSPTSCLPTNYYQSGYNSCVISGTINCSVLGAMSIPISGGSQIIPNTTIAPSLPPQPANTPSPTPILGPSTTPTPDPLATTYYVATTGNDSNPGTPQAPWKTAAYAASKLIAGQTAIFRDGVYKETTTTTFATANGTFSAPITIRAEHKRGATLSYSSRLTNNDKVSIRKAYVIVDGFVITQDIKGTQTGDVLIRCYGQQVALQGDDCTVTNSEFRNAAIGIKFNSDRSLAAGNLLVDMSRTGIDILNGVSSQVIGNEVANTAPANSGIYDKGGSRNTVFNGNYIHSSSTMSVGVMLGGGTGYQWIYRPSNTTPSEAFNSVAINNVVISETVGAIRAAYGVNGCDTCSFSNNISIGTQYALSITNGGDPTNSGGGGAWTASNRNPSFVNNIAVNCEYRAIQFDNAVVGTLTFDYNLMQSCSGVAGPAQPSTFSQPHGVSGDPLFVNAAGLDFHLRPGSPAIAAGFTLAPFETFSDANTPISPPTPRDRNKSGAVRTIPWNMGIY